MAVELDAIAPGSPEKSELLRRILLDHPEKQAPPPWKSKKPKLSAKEIELLRQWIAEGAEYEGHWAFLPVANPHPPEVKDPTWIRNDIDRFVLAELERRDSAPLCEADRATLIRRVSLDLIGLPPSPDEVREFIADQRPDAYERLVDRLLASQHYGERVDVIGSTRRYAYFNGYTIDSECDVAVSRLGHQGAERRPAVRPIHHRATRRRLAS